MACYGGLKGILSGLTKSTDHPRMVGVLAKGSVSGRLDPPGIRAHCA